MKAMYVRWSAVVAIVCSSSLAYAVNPYVIPGFQIGPVPGPSLQIPSEVYGKELSFDLDQGIPPTAPFLFPDPQQVLAWDGTGGMAESFDYSGSIPGSELDRQTDALAANTDALFFNALSDTTHLAYSISASLSLSPIAAATPINPSARPQDVEYALRGAQGGGHETWAVYETDINSDPNEPVVFDLDGLELWGGEPGTYPGGFADSNKYSHANDAGSGVSVWNYAPGTNTSTPYLGKFGAIGLDDAVQDLLGELPDHLEIDDIDLDALMCMDLNQPGFFDRAGPENSADQIIFSIRQIIDTSDPTGFYATGSELFVYDGDGNASWLSQGGHLWNKTWALQNMVVPNLRTNGYSQQDIDALEAVSFPEPTSIALLALGGIAMLRRRS